MGENDLGDGVDFVRLEEDVLGRGERDGEWGEVRWEVWMVGGMGIGG